MVDCLGSIKLDVADAIAGHSARVLAIDGRLDRTVFVLGRLFPCFIVDGQNAAPSLPISVGFGLRDWVDHLRGDPIVHDHWICVLYARPLADPMACDSSNREPFRRLWRRLHDDAQHGLAGRCREKLFG